MSPSATSAGARSGWLALLTRNRNYRWLWIGQIVSEIGDHFNNIAVFSLVYEATGSGLVVTGVMLARAIPVILAGPVAGVVLDRFDRRLVMLWSDIARFLVGLAFLLTLADPASWLVYLLSGLLMFASPFFSSGRQAILGSIVAGQDLHSANSLTQATRYVTVAIGSLLGGASVAQFGYEGAFLGNAVSFLFSAGAVAMLRLPPGSTFRPKRDVLPENDVVRPWSEYVQGLRFIRSKPMVMAIALTYVGWATGGGAAQILFTLFGEEVYQRGAEGIGTIWGFAGIGLVAGSALGHWLGHRLSFSAYKHVVGLCLVLHGTAYVAFSIVPTYAGALFFIALSRMAMAVTTVLNVSHLLHHVPDSYMGRVFSTIESGLWAMMIVSLSAAGVASQTWSPRGIGVAAGALSSLTGGFWAIANSLGKLPEPQPVMPQREQAELPPIRPTTAG